MRNAAVTIIFALAAALAATNAFASDQSCMSSPGVWIGYMCPTDQTGSGSVVDCAGMGICNRPTGGTCTQSAPVGYECVLPDNTRHPCGAVPCLVTYPGCFLQGGTESPIYNYQCSKDGQTYTRIDDCQSACGADCECPIPGIYNQVLGLCDTEPIYQCPTPYAYDTTYYECIVDRKCPDQTAWDDNYGKCIGDPIWVCANAPDYKYIDANARCEKTPPDCPTSTTTPPLWEPDFLTNGKCTTTQQLICNGAPAYQYNGSICTAGSPTCSLGTYDPTHQRCEVSHGPPTCDTANGYTIYDPGNGECYKSPPTCSAGGWSYTNHRCEQGTTPGPATCSANNNTYPDYATCVANCSTTTTTACVGGGFSPAGANYYYGGGLFTITGSGSTLNIGGSVSNLGAGVTASGSCTVSTTIANYITASGNTLTFAGGCTITFTGITWNPGQINIVYPPCGSPNGAGGFNYYIGVSGGLLGWTASADWGSYTEECGYSLSYSGGSYGTCPYTGQPCTGPYCSQTTGGTCTLAGGTCSAGWTIAGSVCWQNGTCPGGGNYQPGQDRCWKMATNPCPPGMSYDGSHVPTVCQTAAYCPPGGSISPTNQCQSTYTLVCPTNYPAFDSASQKCWADPLCPGGAYDNLAKLCWQTPTRVCPNAQETTYEPALDKCTAELTCPAPGIYDPIINKCMLAGTVSCQDPYTYDSVNKRCTYTPPCTPSDWMCPTDTTDPMCNNTAPVTKKTYIEIGTGTTDSTGKYTPPPTYTFATFTSPMIQSAFETQAATYGGHPADLTYRDQITTNFGNGPYWVQGGVLFKDVFFATEGTCYSATDYATPPRTWRPKDYATAGCANWPAQWERIESACLCTQFQQDTYTRVCDANPPYYTETMATTTVPVNVSACSGTPMNCTSGLLQEGLNQCTGSLTTYSAYITCPVSGGSITIPQTKVVKTCSAQVDPATFPVEYRSVPISNYGIVQWETNKCTPCQAYSNQTVVDVPAPPSPPEAPPYDPTTCTNFKVFSGTDKRCHKSGMETIFTDCCDLDGWFPTWCDNEEKELKKRRLAGTCHDVGEYCSKRIKFLFVKVCVQKKETYCCFNSKLSRILNEQMRPQLNRNFGSAEKPDCKGFTPEEFAQVDFSQVDLQEYVDDIQANTGKGTTDILKGMNEWIQEQYTTPGNPAPATKKE